MYLVFDVGGTTIKYAWMTADGEILEKQKVRTPCGKEHTVSDFVDCVGAVYDSYREKGPVEGIAVGLPGQVDVENGIVYGGGGIRYMHDVPLMELLSQRCGGLPVSLENDAKCAALAEVWKGNAKDVDDAYVLVFGTGIGGAVIKDRKVHRGKKMLAGEVSYIFQNATRKDIPKIQQIESMTVEQSINQIDFIWSAQASTGSVCYKTAKKRGLPVEEVTGERIYQWSREGDADAQEILEDMYFNIAKECCNLYVIFNPEVILIGGGISAEPAFIEGIRRYVDILKRTSLVFDDIHVDVCKFRNDSNLLGALYHFRQFYQR